MTAALDDNFTSLDTTVWSTSGDVTQSGSIVTIGGQGTISQLVTIGTYTQTRVDVIADLDTGSENLLQHRVYVENTSGDHASICVDSAGKLWFLVQAEGYLYDANIDYPNITGSHTYTIIWTGVETLFFIDYIYVGRCHNSIRLSSIYVGSYGYDNPVEIDRIVIDAYPTYPGGQSGYITDAEITKLAGIATGADVTADNAPRAHVHPCSEITTGTMAVARLPVATALANGINRPGAGLAISSGEVTPDFGTNANEVCEGNDSRLTDARTPTAHETTHQTGGSDALTPAGIGAATAADLTTHEGDTSNPHSVTAAQVGAATSAALTAHEADVANPHAVTAAQAGADAAGTATSEVASHSALDTGVHGAGGDTLATDADITSHAALDTGVHGAGANTLATDADIATHAALPDVHHSQSHSATHSDGGADEITVENLATSGAVDTVLTSNGAGGLTMSAPSGGVDIEEVWAQSG